MSEVGSNTQISAHKTDSTAAKAKTTSNNTPKTTLPTPSKDLPVKNMGGRTFTFCAGWEEIDLKADWVKKLESQYNCKFKNLQLSDYNTLYNSILSGDPLADVMVLSDSNFYPCVQKKLLRNLTGSQYIDVNDSG